jgi:hypothetical protein
VKCTHLPEVRNASTQDHNTHIYAHEKQQFEVMPPATWLLHLQQRTNQPSARRSAWSPTSSVFAGAGER